MQIFKVSLLIGTLEQVDVFFRKPSTCFFYVLIVVFSVCFHYLFKAYF